MRRDPFVAALLAITLAGGLVIGAQRGESGRLPECGATGPVVAVLRDVDGSSSCVVTGAIINARIEQR